MKKSKVETAATRRRILEVAAQAFRAKGIDGTGVAEIMAAAGLTHGAFYRHFESKEALVTEAAALGMDGFVAAAQEAAEQGQLHRHMERYLQSEYRDGVLGGCPVIQLGSDLARADAQTRRGVSAGLEQLIELGTQDNGDSPTAREDAIFAIFALQGAVTLARLVEDRQLARQILAIARERVLGPPPGKARGKPRNEAADALPATTRGKPRKAGATAAPARAGKAGETDDVGAAAKPKRAAKAAEKPAARPAAKSRRAVTPA